MIWQFLSVVAFVFTLVMNGAATSIPLNNRSTKEISDMFPTLFTPAGYVFAIWGVIYLGLLAFTVYQALPSQRENPLLVSIRPWFVVNCILNGSWIAFWHYGHYNSSLVIMLAILITLVIIYREIETHPALKMANFYNVTIPFSIYLGWISVAIIANTAIVLYNAGAQSFGLGPVLWSSIMIAIAAGIGAYMLEFKKDVAFGLVLIWAFIGIAVKQSDFKFVELTAIGAAVLLTFFTLFDLPNFGKRR